MGNKTKDELISLSTNLSETALDSIMAEGIFKDIPVIGSMISVGKLIYSISDYFLFTRIIHFINELDLKNQQDVDDLKRKYFSDNDYNKIGSKILLTLERSDDQKKIKWLAKCFRLFLDKFIIKDEFMRLTSILNNSYVSDLEKIIVFDKRKNITSHNDLVETYVLDHLFSIGLLESHGFDGGNATGENAGTIYGLNKFGQKIKDLIIK
jgi:hypothetical protein